MKRFGNPLNLKQYLSQRQPRGPLNWPLLFIVVFMATLGSLVGLAKLFGLMAVYRKRRPANRDPYKTTAKFDSTCPETQKQIKKGETIVYFPATRSAVHTDSPSAARWRSQKFADDAGLADAGW
jgi:hypothetical protein